MTAGAIGLVRPGSGAASSVRPSVAQSGKREAVAKDRAVIAHLNPVAEELPGRATARGLKSNRAPNTSIWRAAGWKDWTSHTDEVV